MAREDDHDRPYDAPDHRAPAGASAATTLLALSAGPAAAGGPDPDRLEQAGWFCFGHTTAAIHCVPDGEALASGAPTSTVLSWDGETREFWGTELLIHEELYNGQPCPQDGVDGDPGEYLHGHGAIQRPAVGDHPTHVLRPVPMRVEGNFDSRGRGVHLGRRATR